MAGKITELTEDATPLLSDWLEYTTDPLGTPLSRRCSFLNLFTAFAEYAMISRDSASPGAQTGVIGTSYVKIDQFDTDGPNSGATPSHANDQITVGSTGIYLVHFGVSFEGSNTTVYTVAVHTNTSEEPSIRIVRSVGTGTDVGSAARVGILSLTAGDVLDLRVKANAGSKDFDMHTGVILAVRII